MYSWCGVSRHLTWLSAIVFSSLVCGGAFAQIRSPDIFCPTNNGRISWKTYFHLHGMDAPHLGFPLFAGIAPWVTFEEDIDVEESPFWAGSTYRLYYLFTSIDEPRQWVARGTYSDLQLDTPTASSLAYTSDDGRVVIEYLWVSGDLTQTEWRQVVERGSFGDPNEYEFSIRGHIFVFNEAGEVYVRGFGKVGQLYCPARVQ